VNKVAFPFLGSTALEARRVMYEENRAPKGEMIPERSKKRSKPPSRGRRINPHTMEKKNKEEETNDNDPAPMTA
jgi:hypothetical protein